MPSPAGESTRAIVPLPLLRGIAAIVVAASIAAGARALRADLIIAFRDAGPSVFHPAVTRQIETIKRELPAGAHVLLISASHTDGSWYTRLFQRALYPRNEVIVRYLPFTRQDAKTLRSQWSIRYGIALSPTFADLEFSHPEDLGSLPAMPDHVWLGELVP